MPPTYNDAEECARATLGIGREPRRTRTWAGPTSKTTSSSTSSLLHENGCLKDLDPLHHRSH